jgi:hypothetical protein
MKTRSLEAFLKRVMEMVKTNGEYEIASWMCNHSELIASQIFRASLPGDSASLKPNLNVRRQLIKLRSRLEKRIQAIDVILSSKADMDPEGVMRSDSLPSEEGVSF